MSELVEFLLARIAEDEAVANGVDEPYRQSDAFSVRFASCESDYTKGDTAHVDRWSPARVLAECAARRAIIELHKQWPVLVEQDGPFVGASERGVTGTIARQMVWITTQEYIKRFGTEPPTSPIISAMAQVYADHPDFREEWRQ